MPTDEADAPDAAAGRLLLQSWFSSAFPTGAYAYSQGLEAALGEGHVRDGASGEAWLLTHLSCGSGWNDAVLLAASWHAAIAGDDRAIRQTNELALALCAGAERWQETTAQGDAFRSAVAVWRDAATRLPSPPEAVSMTRTPTLLTDSDSDVALPVAAGLSCACSVDLPLSDVLGAQALGSISNLVWIAVRLLPLGQAEGVALLARLLPAVRSVATRATHSTLADVGSGALLADLCSLQHEQMSHRLCIT